MIEYTNNWAKSKSQVTRFPTKQGRGRASRAKRLHQPQGDSAALGPSKSNTLLVRLPSLGQAEYVMNQIQHCPVNPGFGKCCAKCFGTCSDVCGCACDRASWPGSQSRGSSDTNWEDATFMSSDEFCAKDYKGARRGVAFV
jgi:hypothetical protein